LTWPRPVIAAGHLDQDGPDAVVQEEVGVVVGVAGRAGLRLGWGLVGGGVYQDSLERQGGR